MPISMGLIYRKTGQKSNLILKVFITYAVERIGGGVTSFMGSGHKGLDIPLSLEIGYRQEAVV